MILVAVFFGARLVTRREVVEILVVGFRVLGVREEISRRGVEVRLRLAALAAICSSIRAVVAAMAAWSSADS